MAVGPQVETLLLEASAPVDLITSGGERPGAEGGGVEEKGGGGGEAGPTPCYCSDKYHVRFVDMLTYPRPIRKFKVRRGKKPHVKWRRGAEIRMAVRRWCSART
jgi:hypothetical protein